LQELNTKLALKEELASKLMAGMNHMSSIGTDYENSMKDLQQQISDLQKEKDELMHILQKVQNRNSNELVFFLLYLLTSVELQKMFIIKLCFTKC
jgi:alpha-galactosidase/6-phospho-beta-glucosidase family protein